MKILKTDVQLLDLQAGTGYWLLIAEAHEHKRQAIPIQLFMQATFDLLYGTSGFASAKFSVKPCGQHRDQFRAISQILDFDGCTGH